ncbi:Superfamily II DNA or RNA helicase, SNF2 family [Hathewaya proteolytica DSM 3090]|uniref:Superfamily II DNA or RNA helicase, SNF2 family n=1 Tax=Hathewaya proteolytica DSM 3090 TaxID=1121331 RepID=A0A1M6MGM6_9CLOT|nr:DEAD/DEAH box helicase [Hathewaya proteolytica]SHJ82510.1 Superfamily II DNA or RNA helicase, SNF2 family [Hathewaya proteolytica DSM 3090]
MSIKTYGNIKELCSDFILLMGEQCYDGDYVEYVDKAFEDDKIIEVEAEVLPYTGYRENICYFKIDKKTKNLMGFRCSCMDEGRYKGVCEHLVAAYLKYINEYDDLINKDIEDLINAYKQPLTLSRKVQRKDYKLYISLTNAVNERTPNYLELKVSEEREKPYVIKSISEFLKSYYFKSSLEMGKKLIIDFNNAHFSDEDTKIIETLMQIFESQEILNMGYGNIMGKNLITGKKAFLADAYFKRIVDIIKDHTFSMKTPMGECENCRYTEEMEFDFRVEANGENIILSHSDNRFPYPLTSDLMYVYYKECVYKMSREVAEAYIPLYTAMLNKRDCKLSIDKHNKQDFASYIIPKISRIGDVKISEELEEEFYRESLSVNIYLDKDQDKVILSLKFCYGEVAINPLNEEAHKKEEESSSKGILVRDIGGETEALDLILKYKFKEKNKDFILENEEDIVNFIVEGLEILNEKYNIFYSDSFKGFKIHRSDSFRCSIKSTGENMLEFSFKLKGMNQEELINIFTSIHNKKNYCKLKNGDIVLLKDKLLKNVADIVNYLDLSKDEYTEDIIKLPTYDAFYIEQKLNDKDIYVSKNKGFIDLISNIEKGREKEFELPKEQEQVLRPYQEVGFKWFKSLSQCGFGGILADEMGLGKTLQTIAFLNSERDKGTALIVCPTSLVFNWEEEIKKFSPNMKALVIIGNKSQRKEMLSFYKEYHVIITSYPLIRRDTSLYDNMEFSYCIIDEAQQIKNPSSQSAIAIKEIKAKNRFALTGTPMENNLSELWSVFDFVMPGYLLNHNKFFSKYESPILKDDNDEAMKELSMKISPFILRRMKKDVIKELPPKIYNNMLVELNDAQKKIYASYATCLRKEIQEIMKSMDRPNKIKILSGLTRLRQICCDPSVFVKDYNSGSGKLEVLYDVINSSIEEGHKILIFSQFTSVLKNVYSKLKKQNISSLYLDGSVKSEDRLNLVRQFNGGNYNIFLISLKAGGTGLNLTEADVVIHVDPWWNPAVEEQATDRCHRIGQKNTVQVIKLIAKGTIEEKIVKLQEKKKLLAEAALSSHDLSHSNFNKMDLKELADILSL